MQTVGEILRSEREKKGLSLKDIELGTSIRTLYIKAIEENNYKVVPGEVYLKGFIRNYASYLGLDAQSIMEVYRQSQSPLPNEKAEALTKTEERTAKEEKTTERSDIKHKGFGLVATVLLIVVAGGTFWWFTSGQTPNPAQETKPAPVAPSVPSQPQTSPLPQNKPVMVTAKFTSNCWTMVMADDKEVYQGTVKAGQTLSWEAEKSIVLKLGNAGAVDLTYNGQPAGKLGENGEVVEKTFTAK